MLMQKLILTDSISICKNWRGNTVCVISFITYLLKQKEYDPPLHACLAHQPLCQVQELLQLAVLLQIKDGTVVVR